MSDWFVFADGGEHVGPVSTDLLARGVHSGRVPEDARIARDRADWKPILTVPEVVEALEALRETGEHPTAVSKNHDAKGDDMPEAPSTQRELGTTDMTDVMVRDDELRNAIARAKKGVAPSSPPKAPLVPRSSSPSIPAAPQSSRPGMAPRAPMPSVPPPLPPASVRAPAAPAAPVPPPAPIAPPPPSDPFAALVSGMNARANANANANASSNGDGLPFNTAPMAAPPLSFERAPVAPPRHPLDTTQQSARPDFTRSQPPPGVAPSAPPPPMHASQPPPQMRAPMPSAPPPYAPVPIVSPVTGPPPPVVASAPPPMVASAPPPPAVAAPPMVSVAPAAPEKKDEKKDEKKAPVVDPKLAILIPLGIFAVFVFLSIVVTIYALIAKPWRTPEEKQDVPTVTAPR